MSTDPEEIIAEHFTRLHHVVFDKDPTGDSSKLSHADRTIHLLVVARCAIDMDGFESLFDQVLTEDDLHFIVQALKDLGHPDTARLFQLAHDRITSLGFDYTGDNMIFDLPGNENEDLLDDIARKIIDSNVLWQLDSKLVGLLHA